MRAAHSPTRHHHRPKAIDSLHPPRWLVWGLALVAAGCSAQARNDRAARPSSPCQVQTAEVARDQGPRVATVAGVTEPVRRSLPAVRLMAKVLAADFREGDRVEAGRVLVRLDTRDFRARRRIARASGDAATVSSVLATENLKRAQALFESGAIPRSQLEAAELGASQAAAGAQTASGTEEELAFNLESASIRSPFAGLVVRKTTEVGNLTAPGQPLLILEDDAQLRVAAPIGAELAARLEAGALVGVRAGGQRLTGTVESLVPSGDPRAPGLRVQVLIDNPARLRSGTLAVVEVPLGDQPSPALRIPASAVVRRGQLAAAFVASEGVAQLRWLSLGEATGDSVLVLSGLRAGERIVRSPEVSCVADGRQVEERAP